MNAADDPRDGPGDAPIEPIGDSPADSLDAIRAAVARLTRANAATQADARSVAEPEPQPPPQPTQPPITRPEAPHEDLVADAVRRAEAVLFASAQPIEASSLADVMPAGVEPGVALMRLKALYRGRGVQLVEIAGKWRFQTAPDLAFLFETRRTEQRSLSRAAMETLAIIAYCQPVTRAEIEDVRGVAVSKGTLDVLMEAGWVRPRGRRRTPGRPATYGTTESFLVYFGLDALDSLPGKAELKAAGLLSADIPEGFEGVGPAAAGRDDLVEDPYEDGPDFHVDFNEDEGGDDPAGT
ncbi:SMC-Scp complex subunit ScpB [bacterium]|nr:SMC-Scp complex subunit ScpB [bacterium]